MAILILPANLAKLLGRQAIESPAPTVQALMDEIRKQVPAKEWKQARRAAILVNGVAIHRLEGSGTPLGPKDEVWMVLPSGGG